MKATFRFGIHPKDRKELTKDLPFETMEASDKVYIPVRQHIGAPSKPLVKKGDKVKAGSLVAQASGFVSANIHSSVSGEVEGFEMREDISGKKIEHIVIKNDFNYEEENMPILQDPSSEEIIERIKQAGIVGMGGATFPTHVKLMPKNPVTHLIINGAECEPYITADYRLMLEKPQEIIEGILLLKKALKANKAHIGIEDNKPQAIETMTALCQDKGINVVSLKTKYPQGGEKQLIYAITKKVVPKGGLPADVGCVVSNVSTAFAVYEAVKKGKPSYARFMTVSGKGIAAPKNLYVRNGIPFEEIASKLGTKEFVKAVCGGPMMGIALPNLNAVTTKGASALLLLTEEEIRHAEGLTCINCARCHKSCPMNLMPMMIDSYMQKNNLDAVKAYDPDSCIECGCCGYVCPAKIPLVQSIRLAKKLLKERK